MAKERALSDDGLAVALGREIAAERTAQGMTQAELGARIGVEKNSVWRYEHGDRGLDWDGVKAVARALGLKAWQLVMRAEEREERGGVPHRGSEVE
jgi:transcriptional regulator with XRE-family HTH domain